MSFLAGGAAGLLVGIVSGVLLSFLRFDALSFLPLLLMGYLVGESVSAAANRKSGLALAIVAFMCAFWGPLLGRSLLFMLTPVGFESSRAAAALVDALAAQGPFGILLLMVAGVIAATRVQNR